MSAAEASVLKGDSESMRSHMDFSGIPPNDLARVSEIIAGWKGVSPELRHVSTEVVTPAEFTAREEKDFMERAGRASTLPPTKWNIQPEKLIVFTFVSKDPGDKVTNIHWFAGVFRKNGLWYFSISDL